MPMDGLSRGSTATELYIASRSLSDPGAIALIAALNAELAAIYPEPGATHFRLDPNEVGPGAGAFVVAEWRSEPVACGAVRWLREPDLIAGLGARVGEVKRMYVAPAMRGHGIARLVLDRLEHESRALGLDRLVLETGTRQLAAIALYRRAGFTDIPPFGEYKRSPGTSVCLAKSLTSDTT